MNRVVTDLIVQRIQMAHRWLLESTVGLSEENLCRRPSLTAPPIGWHLWHISRWADRLQATLPRKDPPPDFRPDPNHGIWEREQLAQQWDLDPRTLGTLEDGSGMEHDAAAALPRRIGRDALIDYARRAFAATDMALGDLEPEQLLEARSSIQEYLIANGGITRAPGRDTTLAADLAYHFSHANRHLGMIEALCGLRGTSGSVTV
jgi:hypothetical protein